MRVLLIKPETIGIFAVTRQVEHEPLELEYLYTVLKCAGLEPVIYDRRHDLTSIHKKLKEVQPEVVCITGYITQEPIMIRLTHYIKKWNRETKVIIGGSQAEINYQNFYRSEADYIYHLSGLHYFMILIRMLQKEVNAVENGQNQEESPIRLEDIKGICYRRGGDWICNEKVVESPQELPIPDRSYFYRNKNRYRYMTFHPLALIKNSYSCPYSCSFCYCTNRNGGQYRCRSITQLVDEIEALQVGDIHITDDNFLTSREYLKEFIRLIKERHIHKRFLIYGRADFIAENEELMAELASVGISLIMVGLEATNDEELDAYHKKVSVKQNEECVRILDKYGIICSGLFIVHQEMTKKDFANLYQWISSRPIISTISIFTPMQGTENYKEYENKMITRDIRKQDLFHCILKPKYMSVFMFHLRYYRLSLRLAFNNRKKPLMSSVGLGDFVYLIRVGLIRLKRLFVI